MKIIKNRLRTSLADESLSSLLVLASENDLLRSLDDSSIIDNFARTSPSLKSLLLFD